MNVYNVSVLNINVIRAQLMLTVLAQSVRRLGYDSRVCRFAPHKGQYFL